MSQQSILNKRYKDTKRSTNKCLYVQEFKDSQMDTFINTTSQACSTIESLPKGCTTQRDALLYWTTFNGKQDHLRPNKIVPPKDAQLLEGSHQR